MRKGQGLAFGTKFAESFRGIGLWRVVACLLRGMGVN